MTGKERSKSAKSANLGEMLLGLPGTVDDERLARLKSHLKGKVKLEVSDTKSAFCIELSGDKLKVQEGGPKKADCTIESDEATLLDVLEGGRNPQITMLSDKMVVTGKPHLAVYFFNLFSKD